MRILEALQIAAGAVLVAAILYDFFQAVVLPHPVGGRWSSPSTLVMRQMWLGWRAIGARRSDTRRQEAYLAAFGPLVVLVLLTLRGVGLITGYTLMLAALPGELSPRPSGFADVLYLSTTSLLTLGSDVQAVGAVARVLVSLEAATGLGLVALVVSFLLYLFGAFQRREVAVVALDAVAGAPPSGVQLLESCAEYQMPGQLERTFDGWREWSAEVLQSHLAYPVLIYFRSTHDNEAWLNSFGAVMDAATLVLTTVEGGPVGTARLMFKVGAHLIEDIGRLRRYVPDGLSLIEREEFTEACRRLREAGYVVRDDGDAWVGFERERARYASSLNRLAAHLAITPAPWIGDRSYLPHRDGTAARRARTRR
jgi:hypothetical protein